MEIQITSHDGSKWKSTLTQGTVPQYKYNGYRCLHMAEGGYPNPMNQPEVRPSMNISSVPFNEPMQLVSYRVNAFNPLYTRERWRVTYNGKIAFTNGNGFDCDTCGTRVDYVNRRDLGYPLPKLMKGIICGGGFYTGTVGSSLTLGIQEFFKTTRLAFTHGKELLRIKRSNSLIGVIQQSLASITSVNVLILNPGVDAVDATKVLTDIDTWANIILAKHWYFHAVIANMTQVSNFPQGQGKPVYVTLFLNKPAMYPLSWFERWVSNELPDPLKIYHPI